MRTGHGEGKEHGGNEARTGAAWVAVSKSWDPSTS